MLKTHYKQVLFSHGIYYLYELKNSDIEFGWLEENLVMRKIMDTCESFEEPYRLLSMEEQEYYDDIIKSFPEWDLEELVDSVYLIDDYMEGEQEDPVCRAEIIDDFITTLEKENILFPMQVEAFMIPDYYMDTIVSGVYIADMIA